MVEVKIKKRYIEEIDRLLNTSGINYEKGEKKYNINSSLSVINDLLGKYIKLSDNQKEELYKNDNEENLYIDQVIDKYNPDVPVERNRVELDEDIEYEDDFEEIFY